MATIEQDDCGAGIYRGRRAPPGSVYDALNALVDDEGQLFLRGKTAYKSGADAGSALEGLAEVFVAGGQRTVFWSETGEDIYTLAGDDSTVVTVSASGHAWRKFSRGVVLNGVLWLPDDSVSVPLAYGGSRKTSDPPGFNASFTAASKTVTSTGTSWLTTADAGMIVVAGGIGPSTGLAGVVKTVVNDTTLELVEPWPGGTTSTAAFLLRVYDNAGLANDGNDTDSIYLATAGRRLLMAQGSKVYFTEPDDSFQGDGQSMYHQLPDSAAIVGADALADTAVIFTTSGVWAISNLVFDPVDDAGNVQHQVEQVSKDLILWGDPGIAAWESVLVVPAVDDVYLFALSGETRPISEGIRPLYRSYVKAGYQPGTASVHRGHYLLPILNGSTLVDVLVCRLDRPYGESGIRPWTRWAGHAAGAAYGQRIGATTRSPKLLGISGQRVTDLTGCMDAASVSLQDADLTTSAFRVDFNDDDLGPGIRPNTAEKVRFVYETFSGSPVIDVSYSTGPEGSAYSAAVLKRGGGASDGTDYSAWRVGKKAERIRFRFECSSQLTSLILRRREVTVRQAAQN